MLSDFSKVTCSKSVKFSANCHRWGSLLSFYIVSRSWESEFIWSDSCYFLSSSNSCYILESQMKCQIKTEMCGYYIIKRCYQHRGHFHCLMIMNREFEVSVFKCSNYRTEVTSLKIAQLISANSILYKSTGFVILTLKEVFVRSKFCENENVVMPSTYKILPFVCWDYNIK